MDTVPNNTQPEPKSQGSTREGYYALRDAFETAQAKLPEQLLGVPEFYKDMKTFFCLRKILFPHLLIMRTHDKAFVQEWVRRHWPAPTLSQALLEVMDENCIDMLAEPLGDLRAYWHQALQGWHDAKESIMQEEVQVAHLRALRAQDMVADFLTVPEPPGEKQLQRIANESLAARRYREEVLPFVEVHGWKFALLARMKPSVACTFAIEVESPSLRAALWSHRENPMACTALRDSLLAMQSGKGEMHLSKFLGTYFTAEGSRAAIERSRKLPVHLIADSLIMAGIFSNVLEALRKTAQPPD